MRSTKPTLGFTPLIGSLPPIDNRLPEYLVNEVLTLNPGARAYHLSQRLAALYPDRHILEVADRSFNPTSFAEAGECVLRERPVPHPRITTHLKTPDNVAKHWPRQAWFDVEWRGETLEMLLVEDADSSDRPVYRYFVLATSKEQSQRFFVAVCLWDDDTDDELFVYDGWDWSKDKEMARAVKSTTFDSLVLPGSMKDDILHDVSWFFSAETHYRKYSAAWKRGILLVGPPGNGKTHTIKALINAVPQRVLYVQSFRNGNSSMEEVFAKARKCAPCILILEDLDSMVNKKTRSFFLNQLDGFSENHGILTIGSSNHPEKLDTAIADRPSRFDRKYHFGLPGEPERLAHLRRWNDTLDPEMRLGADVVTTLGTDTDGFSYAYLKELTLSSAVWWVSTAQAEPFEAVVCRVVAILRQQMAATRSKENAKRS